MILGDYKVTFMHDATKGTRCVIANKETKAVEYSAWAIIGNNDQFCRAKGRKVSLTRAMKDIPRVDRSVMWLDYMLTVKL